VSEWVSEWVSDILVYENPINSVQECTNIKFRYDAMLRIPLPCHEDISCTYRICAVKRSSLRNQRHTYIYHWRKVNIKYLCFKPKKKNWKFCIVAWSPKGSEGGNPDNLGICEIKSESLSRETFRTYLWTQNMIYFKYSENQWRNSILFSLDCLRTVLYVWETLFIKARNQRSWANKDTRISWLCRIVLYSSGQDYGVQEPSTTTMTWQ
jgi:hypothetical protein